MEAKKKYLIIGIVFMLMVTIGFSAAYWTAQIIGSGKDMVVETDELKIIFTDNAELKSDEVKPGWETSKTFSVENKSGDVYYYDILMENLINTFVNDYLEYKITCTSGSGSSMNEFMPVPKSSKATTKKLLSNIEIQDKEKQEYKIEFRYVSKENENQSDDMGKTIKGNLKIGEYKISKSLVFFEDKFKDAVKREDDNAPYDSIVTEAKHYYEDGKYTEDGNKVYYYAGSSEDNWVYFGKFYWRIIRMNEDESIRLLYAGTSPETEEGYINENVYNDVSGIRSVGYMYGENDSLEANRDNTYPSMIKTELDIWYENNLETNYDKYISKTAIYCNDRSTQTGWKPIGDTNNRIDFNGFTKFYTNKYHPGFKCGIKEDGNLNEDTPENERVKDMFSVSQASGGNGALTKPIGLMTADEIVYAGGIYSETNSDVYYIRNSLGNSVTGDENWWTMTPAYSMSSSAVFNMWSSGGFWNIFVSDVNTVVRPVISLKSCVEFEGSGLSNDPYTVKEFADGSSCALAEN